jgi:hypothetical protein
MQICQLSVAKFTPVTHELGVKKLPYAWQRLTDAQGETTAGLGDPERRWYREWLAQTRKHAMHNALPVSFGKPPFRRIRPGSCERVHNSESDHATNTTPKANYCI